MITSNAVVPFMKASSYENREESITLEELQALAVTTDNKEWLGEEWKKSLKELDTSDLAQINVPDEFQGVLVESWMSALKGEKSFLLSDTEFSLSSIRAFSEVLKTNEDLENLLLCNHTIDDSALVILAEAIGENSSLQELHFHNNSLGDEGAKALVAALKENLGIKKVELRNNMIGDEGASAFAEVFDVTKMAMSQSNDSLQIFIILSSLEVLDLSYNDIGDAGAISLSKALVHKEASSLPNPRKSLMPPPSKRSQTPPSGFGSSGMFGGGMFPPMPDRGGGVFPPLPGSRTPVPKSPPGASANPLSGKSSLKELDLRHNPMEGVGNLAFECAKKVLGSVKVHLPGDPDRQGWISEQGRFGSFNYFSTHFKED